MHVTLVDHYKGSVVRLLINGVAMGTKMAVAYTNIFMGQLEKHILSSSSLKICFYRSFIDDVVVISNDTEAELINFINDLNRTHPKIKVKNTSLS